MWSDSGAAQGHKMLRLKGSEHTRRGTRKLTSIFELDSPLVASDCELTASSALYHWSAHSCVASRGQSWADRA